MQTPKYMRHFKCIGGACEDNCCIGWDVDIDKTTYVKYQNVTHPLMRRELKRYVKVNPDVYSDAINYAFAVLTPEKHCSFLNADRLCMIQKHLGESYLSNVCDSFPRIINKIDGRFEQSATPSCPEVMRLLAEDDEAMDIEHLKTPASTAIITFDIKQSDKRFKGTLISSLLAVRDACLHQFETQSASRRDLVSLESQLVNLSNFIVEIVALERKDKLIQLPTLIEKYEAVKTTHQNTTQQNTTHQNIKQPTVEFLNFSEGLIKHLEQVGANDSERYMALSHLAMQGDVSMGFEQFKIFNEGHPHILRNLIKNHIFKGLFPFSEGDNAEEALWLLLSRYAMIKRQLIGLAGCHNQLTPEIAIEYLQVFSKVIEHHKHFEGRTIESLKSQKMHTEKLVALIFQDT